MNCYSRDSRKFLHILPVLWRILDGHGFVRTPGRQHFDREAVPKQLCMIFQRIGRIVCSAERLHSKFLNEFMILRLSPYGFP